MAIGDVTIRTVRRRDGTSYQTYQGEYRDRDGNRAFVSDRKKHEAQEKLRTAMGEVDARTHAKGSETLQAVIAEYIYDREKAERRGDISNSHLKNEKYNVGKIPNRLLRMKISAFKHSGEFKVLADDLRDQGFSIRMVDGVLGTISRVFTFAMDPMRGYVARNVLRDFPVNLGKPPKRSNPGAPEDAAHLLRVAYDEIDRARDQPLLTSVNLYAILFLICQTGLRPQEAFGLQVADIKRFDCPPANLPNVWGQALIQNTYTSLEGFQERTKNDEVRTVLLMKGTVDALNLVERFWQVKRLMEGPGHRSYERNAVNARIVRNFRSLDAPLELRRNGFMFLNSQSGGPYSAGTVARPMARLMRRAGLVQRDKEGRVLIGPEGARHKYSLYSFRHMVATHTAGDLPTHLGASVTGHNEQTYLSTYVHSTPDDQRRIAQSLSNLETKLICDQRAGPLPPKEKPAQHGPWEAEGMTKSTYYRKRAAQKLTD